MFTQKHLLGYALLAFIGLAMVACHFDLFDSFNSQNETGTSAPSETASVAIVGAFDAGRALEIIYGNYDPITRRARWQPTSEEAALFGFKEGSTLAYTNVLMSEKFNNGDNNQYLILTRTLPRPEGCRDCTPVLGGAIFTEVANGWNLQVEKRFIRPLEPADQWQAAMVKFSETRQGARLHWRYLNNGYAEEGDLLLSISGNKIAPVFDRITARNNSNDCDQVGGAGQTCWAYQSKLSFQPGSNPDYDDLVITTSGTKLTEQGDLVALNQTTRYVFTEGKYQQTQVNDKPIKP